MSDLKRVTVLPLIAVVIILSGCSVKQVTIAESYQHFTEVSQKIMQVSEKYDITFIDETNSFISTFDDEKRYQMANRILSYDFDGGYIMISMQNDGYVEDPSPDADSSGKEKFYVCYCLSSESKDFDTKLFTDLVNVMSDTTIAVEDCDEFLSAPASKYPPLLHDDDQTEQKMKSYDPFSKIRLDYDRYLYYNADNSGYTELSFSGIFND